METETKLESPPQNESPLSENKLSIPMAIIVAGVLIAGAIYFSSTASDKTAEINDSMENNIVGLERVRNIDKNDHIRGNINAPVKIIEYSDIECPFCKQFHITMKRIMDEYGKDNKVAWIYRHSPIDSIHPNARKIAEATECANELGGNDKFWEYLDLLNETDPNDLNIATLPKIAETIKLDTAKFISCLNSNKYEEKINADIKNANETGGRGTPWSILIAKNGKKYPINGAQPYEKIKEMIDFALK